MHIFRKSLQAASPEVLITRPPTSFCLLGCDQKLRYDLEWPDNMLEIFSEALASPGYMVATPMNSWRIRPYGWYEGILDILSSSHQNESDDWLSYIRPTKSSYSRALPIHCTRSYSRGSNIHQQFCNMYAKTLSQ